MVRGQGQSGGTVVVKEDRVIGGTRVVRGDRGGWGEGVARGQCRNKV